MIIHHELFFAFSEGAHLPPVFLNFKKYKSRIKTTGKRSSQLERVVYLFRHDLATTAAQR
jgi:hypothetical protein